MTIGWWSVCHADVYSVVESIGIVHNHCNSEEIVLISEAVGYKQTWCLGQQNSSCLLKSSYSLLVIFLDDGMQQLALCRVDRTSLM